MISNLFRVPFPCGSVTGTSKARTIELSRDLEGSPRGIHCGAIGIVGPPGPGVRTRFSVAIHTVMADRDRRKLEYGTGSGITWISCAPAEYAELQAKSHVLDAHYQPFQLVESIYHDPNHGPHDLDGHLERMTDSARHFGIPFQFNKARAMLRQHTRNVSKARVRLRCDRHGTILVTGSAVTAGAVRSLLRERRPCGGVSTQRVCRLARDSPSSPPARKQTDGTLEILPSPQRTYRTDAANERRPSLLRPRNQNTPEISSQDTEFPDQAAAATFVRLAESTLTSARTASADAATSWTRTPHTPACAASTVVANVAASRR